jgi:hypothetical protein
LNLRGNWKGDCRLADGQFETAYSWFKQGGVIMFEGSDSFAGSLPVDSFLDAGGGRFSLRPKDGPGYLGIFRQDGNLAVLCFRPTAEGYPTSFRGGDGQYLLTLRRVKPRK